MGGESGSERHGAPAEGERHLLRAGAAVAIIGLALQVGLSTLHAGTAQPNESAAVFEQYARSGIWTAVHLGQLAGTILIDLGLLALGRSLSRDDGVARTLALAGTVILIVGSTVFVVQMAVDGIVLRQAIAGWIGADPGLRPTAFLIADTVRWFEKALSASFHLLNGCSLVLLGLSIAVAHVHPRWIGVVGVLAGAGFLVGGWITAQSGFSPESSAVLGPVALIAAAFLVASCASMIRLSLAGVSVPRNDSRVIGQPA